MRLPNQQTTSMVARQDRTLVGHIGVIRRLMSVPSVGGRSVVPAVHFIDWAAAPGAGAAGAILLMRGLVGSRVAYLLGGSAQGRDVSRAAGFVPRRSIPVYTRVLRPWFRLVDRRGPWLTAVARSGRDTLRLVRDRPTHASPRVTLARVDAFGDEVTRLAARLPAGVAFSERTPALLNHYLACPLGAPTAWHVRAGDRTVGLALLTVVQSGGARQGRVVDCLLESSDQGLWRAALLAIVSELDRQGAHVAVCYGGRSQLADACVAAGMRVTRQLPFFVRDRLGLMPDGPVHMTHLEADHALF